MKHGSSRNRHNYQVFIRFDGQIIVEPPLIAGGIFSRAQGVIKIENFLRPVKVTSAYRIGN